MTEIPADIMKAVAFSSIATIREHGEEYFTEENAAKVYRAMLSAAPGGE